MVQVIVRRMLFLLYLAIYQVYALLLLLSWAQNVHFGTVQDPHKGWTGVKTIVVAFMPL